MDTGLIICIAIASFAGIIFLWAAVSIFKKKKDKSKGKKKKKEKKQANPDEDIVVEQKAEKKPKINIKKLKKDAKQEATVEPVFDKKEIEEEHLKKVKEEVEANKQREKQSNKFPFQNMPFPGARTGMPIPMQQSRPVMQTHSAMPQPKMQAPKVMATQTTIASAPKTAFMQTNATTQQDVALIEALKKRGAIKKEQSFGESLMIKEAIDTPVAKADMKKKRNKWL